MEDRSKGLEEGVNRKRGSKNDQGSSVDIFIQQKILHEILRGADVILTTNTGATPNGPLK